MKICPNGHVTGAKECQLCGAKTSATLGDSFPYRMDKRDKRRITQAIREAGGVPVADMQGGCGIGGFNAKRKAGYAR